jgi:serine/threonine protein kinase
MTLEGQQLGEFIIQERLGRGSMGAVYKARQISLDRPVALKILHSALSDDEKYIARFEREARAAGALHHPNLVHVYAAGETEDLRWFAMEYVAGETARERLKRQHQLDVIEAVEIGIQIASALDYGWNKAGLIHRDIKPENIFLSADGVAKLGDLGVAKCADETQGLTIPGGTMGTPNYISPEQVQGMNDVDLRADIYSLGCTLFHLLGGRPPYQGESTVEIIMKHVTEPVPDLCALRPEIPRELAATIMKMMRKSAEARPASHAEVIAALESVRRHLHGECATHENFHEASPNAIPLCDAEAFEQPKTICDEVVPARAKSKVSLYAGVGLIILLLAVAIGLVLPWSRQNHGARSPAGESIGLPPAVADNPEHAPNLVDSSAGVQNTLGMKFVPVPVAGGAHLLFCVWDTRVQDYAAFVKDSGGAWPRPDFEQGPTHPAVGVSWDDAQAFCVWLTRRERHSGRIGAGDVYRLPTDAEWSFAVGLGDREDPAKSPTEKNGKIAGAFPWGTAWPPPENAGNYSSEELQALRTMGRFPNVKGIIAGYHDGYSATSPVATYAANRFGLYDMGGNVWQWCDDWFDDSHKDRVLRGASWNDFEPAILHSSRRYHFSPGTRYSGAGFRCVLQRAKN